MAATADPTPVHTPATRARGTVRWFSHKGFGFIAGDDGVDVYVHHSAIVGSGFRTLPTGASVSYRVTPTVRGPQAVDVVPSDDDGGELDQGTRDGGGRRRTEHDHDERRPHPQ